MKTTIEVPDDLYRRAKVEAVLRGRKLKDLIEEGLRLVLEAPREARRRQPLAVLMKSARGTVDSDDCGSLELSGHLTRIRATRTRHAEDRDEDNFGPSARQQCGDRTFYYDVPALGPQSLCGAV